MRILGLCNPSSGARPERLDELKRFAHAVTGASVQMSVAATRSADDAELALADAALEASDILLISCLLYTSPSPRDATLSRMPSSA